MGKTIILNDNHLGALVHFRREVISSLASDGYKIILVAPYIEEKIELPEGVEYFPVVMNRTAQGISDALSYMSQLKKIFRKWKPDIVFNYTIKPIIFGGIVCKLMGIKSVAFFAGLNEIVADNLENKSLKSKVLKHILKTALKWNFRIIFLNSHDFELVSKNLGLKDKSVLLNGGEGVDLEKYSFKGVKDESVFKVVMVARVLKTKGYEEFAEVSSRVKREGLPIELYLAGGIDELHPYRVSKEQIENDSSNGEFHYMGHVDNIISFLEDASCVVLPSYYNEGMNRSLMEALSMGIPIITTDNRGCRELVIDGKTGFIILPRDSEALYERILKLYLLGKKEREKFRERSREYARERFDVKDVICKYKEIINSL